MFHILGFLFILILALLIIGLSVISAVIRGLISIGRRGTYSRRTRRDASSSTPDEKVTLTEEGEIRTNRRKKLFDKDEGEYIDFEEITE